MTGLQNETGRICSFDNFHLTAYRISVYNVTIIPNLIKCLLPVLYRYDFELFGYTLDGYLELGMTETNSPDTPTT
jgi:hypothetical protein